MSVIYTAGTKGCILKSEDLGISWTKVSPYQISASTQILFHSISAVDSNVAYIACSTGVILVTVDGGNNWNVDYRQPSNRSFYSISMIDENVGVAGGELDPLNFANVYSRRAAPTLAPISPPTSQPTKQPIRRPSKQPIRYPSKKPSSQPSKQPIRKPSRQPSMQPFSNPTKQPSVWPSGRPTIHPTTKSVRLRTNIPTIAAPTGQPIVYPSERPSLQPTYLPSNHPSLQPFMLPSQEPSFQPTQFPTVLPSLLPFTDPSSCPSIRPTPGPTSISSVGTWTEESAIASNFVTGSTAIFFKSISWITSQICIVVGGSQVSHRSSTSYFGIALQSSNGGFSWKKGLLLQTTVLQDVASVNLGLTTYVIAVDARGYAYTSFDNGLTWPVNASISSTSLNGVIIVGHNGLAFAVGGSRILSSSNSTKYKVWRSVSLQNSNFLLQNTNLYDLSECGENVVILVGSSGFISRCMYSTQNSSAISCNQLSTSETDQSTTLLFNVECYGTSYCLAAGSNGDLLRTINTGTSWTKIGYSTGVWNSVYGSIISIISNRYAYYVSSSGGIYYSSNAGLTWKNETFIAKSRGLTLNAINMYSYDLGLVGGSVGNVYLKMPSPTQSPIMQPTKQPSGKPSGQPSKQPMKRPTKQPTRKPVENPSRQPIRRPSGQPSLIPFGPSSQPIRKPSSQPSRRPTSRPSKPSSQPTRQPTKQPINLPSRQPTRQPIKHPSSQPSKHPSKQPFILPSTIPTHIPSLEPTSRPSSTPSFNPSTLPTFEPSMQPTISPYRHPTAQPNRRPTRQPSRSPTRQPSARPLRKPSKQPIKLPSNQPTRQPVRAPSSQPTRRPSAQPVKVPSLSPSSQPSKQPLRQPSDQPIRSPSNQPTKQPLNRHPSNQPTSQPSYQPTINPISFPSEQPSFLPSFLPTQQPSRRPSGQPTRQPRDKPTKQPMIRPSQQPLKLPSMFPSAQPSIQPSRKPSKQPLRKPSVQPTRQPYLKPTLQPLKSPSFQPSQQPTIIPSRQPTKQPSLQPSEQPVVAPTSQPSSQPSLVPLRYPTSMPSGFPTYEPTFQPSCFPTLLPTVPPTSNPSLQPTSAPSIQPSSQPTIIPTFQPSAKPSRQPTKQPITKPSNQPTKQPTRQPVRKPSKQPTGQPSRQPSNRPSRIPTSQPTRRPTRQPTSQPSRQPSRQPTSQPTRQPSQQPTFQPTRQPLSRPTSQPSLIPAIKPSGQPTIQPSIQPSEEPTEQPTYQPLHKPSNQPSRQPVQVPSRLPSIQPSKQPIKHPTEQPSRCPTKQPSMQPLRCPTSQPTTKPTHQSSSQPSRVPTLQPTYFPSRFPTSQPSKVPRRHPTRQPTRCPTRQPTSQPTRQPQRHPSSQPSKVPTKQPSKTPSAQPSKQPSKQPTSQPSITPSQQPTIRPSRQPSRQPLSRPTCQPINSPSSLPSNQPMALIPTIQPVSVPSTFPSSQPTLYPLRMPTNQPSKVPTNQPLNKPTKQPFMHPSLTPKRQPSSQPSKLPTKKPSSRPTFHPTFQPTRHPSHQPTQQPSHMPSIQPIRSPFSFPTSQPTRSPVHRPSLQPNRQPTVQPTKQPARNSPSFQPSNQPSKQPQQRPSLQPQAIPSVQPFWIPSRRPSIQPTSAPSVASLKYYLNITSVQGVEIKDTKLSQSTIKVLITVSQKAEVFINCAGYPISNGLSTIPPSLESILMQKNRVFSSEVSAFVQLNNLIPSTEYDIYCITTSLLGISSPLVNAIQTSVRVSTSCCKIITIDFSALSNHYSLSVVNNGIMTSLSALPSYNISVSLSLQTLEKSVVHATSVLPNDEYFSADNVTSVFYSSVVFGDSGWYKINVSVSGYSAEEYKVSLTNSSGLVYVLASDQNTSAPQLVSAQVCDDGTCILLRFSSYTNRGGFHSGFPCNALLHFRGIAQTSCVWRDDLSISLISQSPLLTVGSTVSVLHNSTITAKCASGAYCSHVKAQNVTVISASSPLVPQVNIAAPATIDSCSSLFLDATNSVGSGGRKWSSVSMSVSDSKTRQPLKLQNFLSRNYSVYVPSPIPKDLLTAGHVYTFTLTLCNYLGICGSDSHVVTVFNFGLENGKSPIVIIPGQKYLNLVPANSLTLRAVAFTQSCSGIQTSANISYFWYIINVNRSMPSIIQSISQDPSIYKLPSYSLPADNQFIITVNVTSLSSGLTATDSVYLTVSKSNVLALLEESSPIYLSATSNLTIDASSSRNMDVNALTGLAAGLSFSWSCVQIFPFFLQVCPVLLHFTNSDQSGSEKIKLSWNHVVNVTVRVTVTVFDSTRSSSTFTDVTVLRRVPTSISIVRNGLTSSAFNTNSSLQLTGIVQTTRPCIATWGYDFPDIPLNSIALTQLSKSVENTMFTSFYLIIRAHTLPQNSNLQFSLSCGNSISYLQLLTNSAPALGTFTLLPTKGHEMITTFTFSASLWTDEDLPLQYQFGYFSNLLDGSPISLSGLSVLTSLMSKLPSGSGDNSVLNCNLLVVDNLGSGTSTSKSTVVYGVNFTSLFDLIDASLSELPFVSSFDAKNVINRAAATSLLSSVDCSGAPNCATLNRNACKNTAQTCSDCVDGFYGDFGDHNTACIAINSFLAINNSNIVTCKQDSDCPSVWYYCNKMNSTCQLKSKVLSSSECSSNGVSEFIDSRTGNSIPTCLISDSTCNAICRCNQGFVGVACETSHSISSAVNTVLLRLIDGLQQLTASDDVSAQNVLDWSSTLALLVTNNAYNLNFTGITQIQNIEQTIFMQATDLQLVIGERDTTNDNVMQSLLGAINAISSVRFSNNCSGFSSSLTNLAKLSQVYSNDAYCGGNKSNSASILIVPSVMRYSDLLAKSILNGMNDFVLTYSNFVLTVSNSPFTSARNRSISVSMLSYTVEPVFANASLTTAVLQTYVKSYSQSQLLDSNPIVFKIYPTVNSWSAVAQAKIHFSDNNNVPQYEKNFVPTSFVTSCAGATDFSLHSYVCADSNAVITRSCTGQSGSFVDFCPIRIPTCNALNISSGLISSLTNCHVTNFSSSNTICECQQPRISGRNLLSSTVFNADSAHVLTTSFKYVPYFRQSAFHASFDNNSSNQSTYYILVGTYSVLWGSALVLLLWGVLVYPASNEKDPKQSKGSKSSSFYYRDYSNVRTSQVANESVSDQNPVDIARTTLVRYINTFFPAVFSPDRGIFDRILIEMQNSHRYWRLIALSSTIGLSHHTFSVAVFKIMSVLSMNMLILLILFQAQFPLTTSPCHKLNTQAACASEKVTFVKTISRCQWSNYISSSDGLTYYQCSNSNAAFSHSAIVYLIFLTVLISALPVGVLDYLFRAMESPVLNSKENGVSPSPDSNESQLSIVQAVSDELPCPPAQSSIQKFSTERSAKILPLAVVEARSDVVKFAQPLFQSKYLHWKKTLAKQSNSLSLLDKSSNLLELEYNQIFESSNEQDASQLFLQSSIQGSSRKFLFFRHAESVVPVVPLRTVSYDVESRSPAFVKGISIESNMVETMRKLGSNILRQRQLLVDRLHDSIARREVEILQAAINVFDGRWGIKSERLERRSSRLRPETPTENLKSLSAKTQRVIVQQLAHTKLKALEIKSNLRYSSDGEIGREIFYNFVLDILGPMSISGQLFAQAFEVDFAQNRFVSLSMKKLAIFLLAIFNCGFFIYMLFVSLNAAYSWQAYYIVSAAILISVEVVIVSSVECLWVHFIVPDMCRDDVIKAKERISEYMSNVLAVENEGLEDPTERPQLLDTIPSVLNAPDFTFVSFELANVYPSLIESLIVMSYRSHLPVNNLTEVVTSRTAAEGSRRRINSSHFATVLLEFKNRLTIPLLSFVRRIGQLTRVIPQDVTNRNTYVITAIIYAMTSSLAATVSWQLQSPLLRMVFAGVLLGLVSGWYATATSLQVGFFIGAVTFLSLFVLFILFDQYRFYDRRFREKNNPVTSPKDASLDLKELSSQLSEIRNKLYIQLNSTNGPTSVEVVRSHGVSFDGSIGENSRGSRAMAEESKSVGSLATLISMAKSLKGSVASNVPISRSSSLESVQRDNEEGGGEISVMIRDMSNEYIVDSSSLSGVDLPSALSLDRLSDDEDGGLGVEIVDHVSVDSINRSVSDTESDDSGVWGGFSFDVYEVNHSPSVITSHHKLVQQHNQRQARRAHDPSQS